MNGRMSELTKRELMTDPAVLNETRLLGLTIRFMRNLRCSKRLWGRSSSAARASRSL